MRYRRLDASGDYSAGHGAADWLVNSPQAVAQAVQTRLRLYTGQWFLDTTEGTPWMTQVLGRHSEIVADLALRNRVLGTSGVTGIASFSSTLNRDARQYGMTAQITTAYDAGTVTVTT
jgi:hypothetical protein